MRTGRMALLVVAAIALLFALGYLGFQAGVEAWHRRRLLDGVDPRVRHESAEWLSKHATGGSAFALFEACRRGMDSDRGCDPTARAALVRLRADAIPALAAALDGYDPNPNVRELAADILVEIGEPATPFLASLLEGPPAPSRANAAECLGRIGDARAFDPLVRALDDRDPLVRAYAARALSDLGHPDAIRPLESRRGREKDVHVRQEIARSLRILLDPLPR